MLAARTRFCVKPRSIGNNIPGQIDDERCDARAFRPCHFRLKTPLLHWDNLEDATNMATEELSQKLDMTASKEAIDSSPPRTRKLLVLAQPSRKAASA
jgi:hypothetical protein